MCIQSNLQAQRRVFFSDLKSGKCTSVVEARLLQFWEARHVKRGGELMWVEMLPVDINVANCRPNILCLWPSDRGYDKRFGQTPGRLSVKKQMKLNC
ncbi:hypothetical protein HID58_019441 [Brassica napus]|uniref:Uncharacterized protein n=1 Tax=Brassica napus TaxID=3708 RepID=A0ABQ8DCQ6_BRANA|nr:hypothetical protein HID58_019441 [Brassica napus]